MTSQNGVAIGVDAGASKTTAVLVGDDGRELRRRTAAGANLRVAGIERAGAELRKAIEPLIGASAGLRAICVGAAGSDRDADRVAIEEYLRAFVPDAITIVVHHDARIALAAFTHARPAFVIVAGTGSIAYGEDARHAGVRAGGCGTVVGDPGSAYALGLAAVRHAAKAFDGIVPRDALAEAIAARLGARRTSELIDVVQRPDVDVAGIADLSRLVGDAGESGEQAAYSIVDDHANALFEVALHVARAIGDGSDVPAGCLTGGAFSAVPRLARQLESHMFASGYPVARTALDPALGAARLALCALRKE